MYIWERKRRREKWLTYITRFLSCALKKKWVKKEKRERGEIIYATYIISILEEKTKNEEEPFQMSGNKEEEWEQKRYLNTFLNKMKRVVKFKWYYNISRIY